MDCPTGKTCVGYRSWSAQRVHSLSGPTRDGSVVQLDRRIRLPHSAGAVVDFDECVVAFGRRPSAPTPRNDNPTPRNDKPSPGNDIPRDLLRRHEEASRPSAGDPGGVRPPGLANPRPTRQAGRRGAVGTASYCGAPMGSAEHRSVPPVHHRPSCLPFAGAVVSPTSCSTSVLSVRWSSSGDRRTVSVAPYCGMSFGRSPVCGAGRRGSPARRRCRVARADRLLPLRGADARGSPWIGPTLERLCWLGLDDE